VPVSIKVVLNPEFKTQNTQKNKTHWFPLPLNPSRKGRGSAKHAIFMLYGEGGNPYGELPRK